MKTVLKIMIICLIAPIIIYLFPFLWYEIIVPLLIGIVVIVIYWILEIL